MELYAVLDNQEHNQERDHIAAMTEEERLEWAFQESMKVDQHRRSTRPLNEENQQHLHRVMFPADNACAFHCMRLIERKRRNEDNCLSADFSSSSCAVTQTFRETIVANISRQWEASVDTLPNWMWSHLMIDGSASVGDLAIRGLTVAAVSSMEQYKEHMSKQSSFGGWFEFAWFSLATNITFNMYDEDSCSVICSFYGKADSNTVTSTIYAPKTWARILIFSLKPLRSKHRRRHHQGVRRSRDTRCWAVTAMWMMPTQKANKHPGLMT